MAISRTTAGLLASDPFANLGAWISSGVWTAAADPTLIPFDPTSLGGITGTPATQDALGCRQGSPLAEPGLLSLVYDGWDGTTPIIQRLATSADGGITWDKQLGVGAGYLVGTADGVGGDWPGLATGWVAKWGSVYYLYRVIQTTSAAYPLNASGPYKGDIWSATSLSTSATWTFVRALPQIDTGWNSVQLVPGSVYFDGTTYHLFCQGQGASGGYRIGRLFASNPGGPWSTDPVFKLDVGSDSRAPENPKVWYSSAINRYCMSVNLIEPDGLRTDQTMLLLSTSVTDWSSATSHRIQHTCPLDSPNAVGVLSPVTGPGGAVPQGEDGSIGAYFDGHGSIDAPSYHLHRTIAGVVLEPSASCARFTSASATNYRITNPTANRDSVAEFACEFRSIDFSNGQLVYEFRRADDSNYYAITIRPSTGMILYKIVAGIATLLQNPLASTELGVANLLHRVRVVAAGTQISAWINGELQIDFADGTFAAGVSVAFRAAKCDGDVRRFSLRTSQTISVTGVGAGTVVTLRGAGGVPFATATGPDPVFTVAHSPLAGIDVGGDRYLPFGGVWGGDVYRVAGMTSPSIFD